jgi:HK97 family phage prohead protease
MMKDEFRAYGLFEVKALDKERRTFSGWATTPATDRMLDSINPLGAVFRNPVVLLHQHKHDQPIGRVTFKKPTKAGIEFDAEIPVIDEQGPLKDRCDTAFGEIRHGIVRAVSIGFRPLKYSFKEDGGIDFESVEIFELSTVSVPALPEAVITSVKAMSPVSKDVLREIKRFDTQWKERGIPLVYPAAPGLQKRLEGNAVKLIASP